ncbi:MAG: IS1/IS6 family transposase [Candidatus Aenigmarchaeota archaeon]|nr:IS1/IS6 family transposase [Candidatus Aenigmarchaeota archaeon]
MIKVKVRCRHCKGTDYAKKGFRKTQKRGKIQKYYCLSCSRYFTNDEGFYRMRNNEKIITMSLDMYLSNLSSRKMRNQLRRHLSTKISHVSILDWVRRYVMRVQKFVESKTAKLGGRVYADETEIDRQGNNDIFWCAVDWETRFINATLYSPNSQNVKDAVKFLQKVKESTETKFVQTDALRLYPRAIRKVFWGRGMRKLPIEHKVNNVAKTGKHNVRIETVFSKIKDRVDDFRGLKALWSAPILMAGIVLQHNFIEAHTTTGRIPCELAGIKVKCGVDRWMGLIKMSLC